MKQVVSKSDLRQTARKAQSLLVNSKPYIYKENILNDDGTIEAYRFHMALSLSKDHQITWPDGVTLIKPGDKDADCPIPDYYSAGIIVHPGDIQDPETAVYHHYFDVNYLRIDPIDRVVFTVWENERGGQEKGTSITQTDDAPDLPH